MASNLSIFAQRATTALIYPKKRINCKQAKRKKMLFDSDKAANNFIKFNGGPLEELKGKAPDHAYYCILCDGYHLTSKKGETFEMTAETRKVLDMADAAKQAKETKTRCERENKKKVLLYASILAVYALKPALPNTEVESLVHELGELSVARLRKLHVEAVQAVREAFNADADTRLEIASSDGFREKTICLHHWALSSEFADNYRRLLQEQGVSVGQKAVQESPAFIRAKELCEQLETAIAESDYEKASVLIRQADELVNNGALKKKELTVLNPRLDGIKVAIRFYGGSQENLN